MAGSSGCSVADGGVDGDGDVYGEIPLESIVAKLELEQTKYDDLAGNRNPESTEKAAEDNETRVLNPKGGADEDDDWEAIANRAAVDEDFFSLKKDAGASQKDVNAETPTPKRRGRGSFLYERSRLYSEHEHDDAGSVSNTNCDPKEGEASDGQLDGRTGARGAKLRHGTRHALVLYDFSPSTKTMELERLFESFRSRGFAIRWVNDTTAVAVFSTQSIAQEAQRSIHFPFKVRLLTEEDILLNELSLADLEPPYPRPKTSTRTAQRLIAHGMGMKFPTDFGSNELRKQETARKSRIVARQRMRDDAWGSDEP